MSNLEIVTLSFLRQSFPRHEAETAGLRAYEYFYGNTKPELSPLTLLSHAVRRYDDHQTLTAEMRRSLTEEGFLIHGERTPLKRRLRLPGIVAVSLVVPELEHDKIVGEYLEEPFREVEILDEWYTAVARPRETTGTRLSWKR
jgi:hypothetical protein